MSDHTMKTMAAIAAAALSLAACDDSLSLKESLEAKVEYAAATYTVTLTAAEGGAVSFDSIEAHNDAPERIEAIADPYSGYVFSGWIVLPGGNAVIADPESESTTVTVSGGDATLRANFTAPMARQWMSIAVSDSGQYLYAGEYRGHIYASTDFGETWRVLRGSPEATWQAIDCDESGRYVLAMADAGGLLYTSSDYGASWTARTDGLPSSPGWIDAACDDAGRCLIAADGNDWIYTSSDYGASWTLRNAANGLARGESQAWSSVSIDGSGQVMLAAVSGGSVFISRNGGQSWGTLMDLGEHYDDLHVSESSDGSRYQIARSYSSIFSTDQQPGDTSWYSSTQTLGWVDVACDDSGDVVVSANYQGSIWTSFNNGNGDYAYHNSTTASILPLAGSQESSWSCVASNGDGSIIAAGSGNGHVFLLSGRQTWQLGL